MSQLPALGALSQAAGAPAKTGMGAIPTEQGAKKGTSDAPAAEGLFAMVLRADARRPEAPMPVPELPGAAAEPARAEGAPDPEQGMPSSSAEGTKTPMQDAHPGTAKPGPFPTVGKPFDMPDTQNIARHATVEMAAPAASAGPPVKPLAIQTEATDLRPKVGAQGAAPLQERGDHVDPGTGQPTSTRTKQQGASPVPLAPMTVPALQASAGDHGAQKAVAVPQVTLPDSFKRNFGSETSRPQTAVSVQAMALSAMPAASSASVAPQVIAAAVSRHVQAEVSAEDAPGVPAKAPRIDGFTAPPSTTPSLNATSSAAQTLAVAAPPPTYEESAKRAVEAEGIALGTDAARPERSEGTQLTQPRNQMPPQQQASQIGAQLASAARQTAPGTMELRLHPEELGRVRLQFDVSEQSLVVSITAERAETSDLMRRHIDQLAREMQSLGYRDVSFHFGGEGAAHGSDSGSNRKEGRAPTADTPMRAPEDTGAQPTSARSPMAADTGLDLRI